MIRRPPRSTPLYSSAASDVYKRQAVRASGAAAVDSHEVGLATLAPLRELDEVAYLRFASVYRSYESLEDFESEISLLRTARELGDVSVAIATKGDKSVEDGSEK